MSQETRIHVVMSQETRTALKRLAAYVERELEPLRQVIAAAMPSPEVVAKMDAALEVVEQNPRLRRDYAHRVLSECADEVLALARRAPRRATPQRRPSRQVSIRRRERVAARGGGGSRAPGESDDGELPPLGALPPFERTVALYRWLLADGVAVRSSVRNEALRAIDIEPKSGTDARARRALRLRSHPDGFRGEWVDELPSPGEFVIVDKVGRWTVVTPNEFGETEAEHRLRHLRAVRERRQEESLRLRVLGVAA